MSVPENKEMFDLRRKLSAEIAARKAAEGHIAHLIRENTRLHRLNNARVDKEDRERRPLPSGILRGYDTRGLA